MCVSRDGGMDEQKRDFASFMARTRTAHPRTLLYIYKSNVEHLGIYHHALNMVETDSSR